MNPETKPCQSCTIKFTIEPEDFTFYQKIEVPPPTFCPLCREQRRIAVRNERALYQRACDLCKKLVVSRVSPDKPYPMYCKDCWWSDDWDGIDYGRDYDFTKPFFQQFHELLMNTPHISLLNINTENSDWVNQETDDKNCYLNVGGHYNQDSAYNTYEIYGKESFDNFWLINSELCYESIACERCYQTHYSYGCFDCRDTILSYDCHGCDSVFGCAGLRHKQYYLFNKPVTKEEYQQFVTKEWIGSHSKLKELTARAHAVWQSVPHRPSLIVKSEQVTGNLINESRNSLNCWSVEKLEHCKHIYIGAWLKDCYDGTSLGGSELCYECSSSAGLYQSKWVAYCVAGDPLAKRHGSNLSYCFGVSSSQDCFGCANLRRKQYCILNKQYSKEEYEALLPKIVEHMHEMPYVDAKGREYRYGEFFPIELAPFGYNETAAMDYFPLSKDEAVAQGYPWSDYSSDLQYQHSGYVVPDSIAEVGDEVTDKILTCEISDKPYKIIPMELQFYREQRLPLPRRAPLQRHHDRMARTLPRVLHDRTCQCDRLHDQHKDQACQHRFQTPYAPDRPEILYCEECYQAEVI